MLFGCQQRFGLAGSGFVAAEYARLQIRVQSLAQLFGRQRIALLKQQLRSRLKALVAALQFANGLQFLWPGGIAAQLQEMLLCIARKSGVFLQRERIAQEDGIEQLLHLAVKVAARLLHFLHQRIDALRFAGCILPDTDAGPAGGACQQHQQHEDQFVDEQQLLERARVLIQGGRRWGR